MDAVEEGDHLQEAWQRLEEVVVLLVRLRALHVEIANEHETAEGQKLFLAAAELGILHVPLHDADEGPGIGEIGVGDFVEHDGVAGADFANLAGVQVNEELRRRCLPT